METMLRSHPSSAALAVEVSTAMFVSLISHPCFVPYLGKRFTPRRLKPFGRTSIERRLTVAARTVICETFMTLNLFYLLNRFSVIKL